MIAGHSEPGGDDLSLEGLRVVVTRSAAQADAMRRPLEAAGAHVLVRPLIRIMAGTSSHRLAAAALSIREYDWAIFTSANAADTFIRALEAAGVDAADVGAVRVAAVGPATAEALAAGGMRVDILPGEHLAAGLADALVARADLAGTRVLWPRAEGADLALARALEQRGATVDDIEAYRTAPDEAAGAALRDEVAHGGIDVLTFASRSAVRAFAPHHMAWSARTRVAAIGPVTAAAARGQGLPVHVQATEHTVTGLVAALVAYFAGAERDHDPTRHGPRGGAADPPARGTATAANDRTQ